MYSVELMLCTSDELIVDIGSGHTWVGAGKTFIQTSTTRQTRDRVVGARLVFTFVTHLMLHGYPGTGD